MKRWVAWSVLSTVMVSGKLGCVFLKLIQLLGKYDSAYQDIDACDHSLEVRKGKLKVMKLIQLLGKQGSAGGW